jgi:hypothetical protein
MADRAFPGRLREPSGEATLDDPSLSYQYPSRLTANPEVIPGQKSASGKLLHSLQTVDCT